MRGCAHSATRPGAECIGELLRRFSHVSKAFVALFAKADTIIAKRLNLLLCIKKGFIMNPKSYILTFIMCKSKLLQSFRNELFCPSFHTALGVVELIVLIQR